MRWQRYSAVCLVVFGVLAWLFSALPALAGAPTSQLKQTIEQAITALDNPAFDDAAKHERLRQVIEPRVDFEIMSQRVLGRHWRDNAHRANEFVPLFKELLERTYIKQVWFKEAKGARVNFLNESVDGSTARVDTLLITAKGEEHPVSYRLELKSEEWKVVDILVLGMSLVSNYRSQFNEILAKRSFDDLLEKLRNKIARRERESRR